MTVKVRSRSIISAKPVKTSNATANVLVNNFGNLAADQRILYSEFAMTLCWGNKPALRRFFQMKEGVGIRGLGCCETKAF